MDTQIIQNTVLKTLAGSIPFPEAMGVLPRADVEYYHVDYVGLQKPFHGPGGRS